MPVHWAGWSLVKASHPCTSTAPYPNPNKSQHLKSFTACTQPMECRQDIPEEPSTNWSLHLGRTEQHGCCYDVHGAKDQHGGGEVAERANQVWLRSTVSCSEPCKPRCLTCQWNREHKCCWEQAGAVRKCSSDR